jgi:hypothetical protein
VLVDGTAPSSRHAGLAGTVMLRTSDFRVLAGQYLAERGFAEPATPSAAPDRFKHPVWDMRDVFGWVLDRDSAKFGRIRTEDDWRAAVWAANFYTTMPRHEYDAQAGQTLLHALQRGELVGFNGTNPVGSDFWIDKTPQQLRGFARFLFRREDVLSPWPDLRAQISRAPPPITPLRGGVAAAVIDSMPSESRAPNWQKWKHVPEVKLYEAVALSLNIAPEKIRPNSHAWMGGKRFDESEEFLDRLFVAQRNLETLQPLNFLGMRYYDEDPVVRLQNFVAWAVSIGWTLPSELAELATRATGGAESATAQQEDVALRQRAAELPSAKRRRGPARGSIDRYGETDRALFPELKRIMKADRVSLTAAALKLAESTIDGKKGVPGEGTALSRAKRLVARYNSDQGKEPSETD